MSDSRLILTRYKAGVLSCYMEKNRIEAVSYYNEQAAGNIGDIFVAKVINVVSNIQAAFIDYQPGKRGFLPIDQAYTPVLINRFYDGRILAGDEILVQLEKEAIRTKDPVFTMNLSLSGKYCVVTNGNTKKGVSAKISRQNKDCLYQLLPQDTPYGVVVRTNAEQLIAADNLQLFENECEQLLHTMDDLLQKGVHRTCYSKVYQASETYLTDLRDNFYTSAQVPIVTDDAIIYEKLSDFCKLYMPEHVNALTLYQDDSYSLKKLYGLETKLNELLSEKVWLKSGAYLVIEQTEAMYVIDVNSGKNTSKKQNDTYIYNINIEAAREIMRQLRLRNLSGIIMVDFINMDKDELQQSLMQELKQLAKQDKIPTTIVDMTALGLVEITRKKTKKSFKSQIQETFS